MQGLEDKIVVYLPEVRRISVITNKLDPLRGTPEAIAQRMRHDPATRPQTTRHSKDGHGSQNTDVINTQPSVSHGPETQIEQNVDRQKDEPQTDQSMDRKRDEPQPKQCVDQQMSKPQTEQCVDRRGDGKKPGEAGEVNSSEKELKASSKSDTDRGIRQGNNEATTHNVACFSRAEHRSGGRSLVVKEMDTGADQTLGAGGGAVAVAMDTGADRTLGAGGGAVAMAVDTDADKLERLGGWNREYLWHVASRCLSHLVVFHV